MSSFSCWFRSQPCPASFVPTGSSFSILFSPVLRTDSDECPSTLQLLTWILRGSCCCSPLRSVVWCWDFSDTVTPAAICRRPSPSTLHSNCGYSPTPPTYDLSCGGVRQYAFITITGMVHLSSLSSQGLSPPLSFHYFPDSMSNPSPPPHAFSRSLCLCVLPQHMKSFVYVAHCVQIHFVTSTPTAATRAGPLAHRLYPEWLPAHTLTVSTSDLRCRTSLVSLLPRPPGPGGDRPSVGSCLPCLSSRLPSVHHCLCC